MFLKGFIHSLPNKFSDSNRPGRLHSIRERGQALVITMVAFMAILAILGLVTDVGSLYLNFTRLKRGLDAAAVAAANTIRDSTLHQDQRNTMIREAARELLSLNDIHDIYSLSTFTCEDSGLPPEFAAVCPDPSDDQRKLAWVEATQRSPVYFLQLFGIDSIPITTHSIGEAATLDVVIVIDTSESMASETPGYTPDFDPSACNASNTCQPLRDAKDAAKAMVDKFFDGYDRVAIVDYNVKAYTHNPDPSDNILLESDHDLVKNTIDAINLYDGPSPSEILAHGDPTIGEINPMDVDGDGVFYEPKDILPSTCIGCGIRLAGDILKAQGRIDSVWVIVLLSDGATNLSDLPDASDPNNPVPAGYTNGFCGGSIGSRMWTNEPNTSYSWCKDSDPTTRHCGPFHANSSECPPDQYGGNPGDPHPVVRDQGISVRWVGNNTPPYDTEDYAMDMADRVALLKSANPNEPTLGEDIAIYTIGLGDAASPPDYDGEEMLRYIANIGDDNVRNPVPDIPGDNFVADPCDGAPHQTSCGNYYYSPSGAYLEQIFEKIAGSIFTRISK
ncbi:MAG: vWA domain-containing protein [Anaerolineales bacterium]